MQLIFFGQQKKKKKKVLFYRNDCDIYNFDLLHWVSIKCIVVMYFKYFPSSDMAQKLYSQLEPQGHDILGVNQSRIYGLATLSRVSPMLTEV